MKRRELLKLTAAAAAVGTVPAARAADACAAEAQPALAAFVAGLLAKPVASTEKK